MQGERVKCGKFNKGQLIAWLEKDDHTKRKVLDTGRVPEESESDRDSSKASSGAGSMTSRTSSQLSYPWTDKKQWELELRTNELADCERQQKYDECQKYQEKQWNHDLEMEKQGNKMSHRGVSGEKPQGKAVYLKSLYRCMENPAGSWHGTMEALDVDG